MTDEQLMALAESVLRVPPRQPRYVDGVYDDWCSTMWVDHEPGRVRVNVRVPGRGLPDRGYSIPGHEDWSELRWTDVMARVRADAP